MTGRCGRGSRAVRARATAGHPCGARGAGLEGGAGQARLAKALASMDTKPLATNALAAALASWLGRTALAYVVDAAGGVTGRRRRHDHHRGHPRPAPSSAGQTGRRVDWYGLYHDPPVPTYLGPDSHQTGVVPVAQFNWASRRPYPPLPSRPAPTGAPDACHAGARRHGDFLSVEVVATAFQGGVGALGQPHQRLGLSRGGTLNWLEIRHGQARITGPLLWLSLVLMVPGWKLEAGDARALKAPGQLAVKTMLASSSCLPGGQPVARAHAPAVGGAAVDAVGINPRFPRRWTPSLCRGVEPKTNFVGEQRRQQERGQMVHGRGLLVTCFG